MIAALGFDQRQEFDQTLDAAEQTFFAVASGRMDERCMMRIRPFCACDFREIIRNTHALMAMRSGPSS